MLMSLLGSLLGGMGGGGDTQQSQGLQLSQINPQVTTNLIDMLSQAQTEEKKAGDPCPVCGAPLERKPGSIVPYCSACGWTPSYNQTSNLGNLWGV